MHIQTNLNSKANDLAPPIASDLTGIPEKRAQEAAATIKPSAPVNTIIYILWQKCSWRRERGQEPSLL
jgi:hypothetical protein